MVRHILSLAVAVAAGLGTMEQPASAAGGAVAIIEEINGSAAGPQAMDALRAGATLMLAPGQRLVVSYLDSCLRETIVGGVVIIGTTQSTVANGQVTREKTECDGGKLVLTSEQASKGATMVFRNPVLGTGGKATTPR